jgi:hypothetical protein
METSQLAVQGDSRRYHKAVTLRDINQANEHFWSMQTILMHSRISDESLLKLGLGHLMSEYARGVPVKAQRSVEQIFADIENVSIHSHVTFSQKGGKKRKSDALQDLIVTFASENPQIRENGLRSRLKKEVGQGVIQSIDSERHRLAGDALLIRFFDHNGKEKTASVRGLKDRLSRAKKEINSR